MDCSFLLTIPLTEDEFLADLYDRNKDFVRGQYRDSALSDGDKWALYEPSAREMRGLAAWLQRHGADVVRRATFHDWNQVRRGQRLVILFTHWRSGLLRTTDVDWRRLEQLLPTARILPRVAEALGRPPEDAVPRLNDLLIDDALGDHPWLGLRPNTLRASLEHRVHANRQFLDRALPGVFNGTTSVEFADGLVPVEECASAFDARFDGIVDLSVCTSVLLAEMIKKRATACLVVSTQLPAILDYRALFYRAVFRRLRPGRSYLETLTEIRHSLLDSVQEVL